MKFHRARDIEERISEILTRLNLPYIKENQLAFVRSTGSTSRARARIWAFPSVWQVALGLKPHYVIEVLAEKFDRLSYDDQTKVLIHELMHIPRTFSGSLRPHRTGTFRLDMRLVNRLFNEYVQNALSFSRREYH